MNRVIILMIGIFFTLPNAFGQVINFEKTWDEFLKNDKVSNVSELSKPPKTNPTAYAQYCLMYANTRFCNSKVTAAEEFMQEIELLGEDNYGNIPGFRERYNDLKSKISASHKADELWSQFLQTRDVDLAELNKASDAVRVCEKGTLAKYTYMQSYGYYCSGNVAKAKDRFENYVLAIVDRTSLKISDVKGLSGEVENMRALFTAIGKLDVAWEKYLKTGKSDGFSTKIPVFECNKTPLIKAYILNGASDVCGQGEEMVQKIKALQAETHQQLDGELAAKVAWLEKEAGTYSGDMAALNTAWEEFIDYNWVDNPVDINKEFCDKEAQIRAYVMYGVVNDCHEGPNMVNKIAALQKAHNPTLEKITKDKIQYLKDKIQRNNDNIVSLAAIWKEFVANGDTMKREFELSAIYCDKISQVMSWTIKGHFDHCDQGEHYLGLIDKITKENDLRLSEEINCRIQRLRVKIWNCQIDALRRAVQLETLKERKRIATTSVADLTSQLNDGQIACKTTIDYEMTDTMGFGVNFLISTYICKDLDLANLTQKQYIQKVADWFNNDILGTYCQANDDCKAETYIYIIGHTDGSPFRNATYTGQYSIPAGNPFMHIKDGKEIEEKSEREINDKLNNNLELAFSRAFTVNYQLEDLVSSPVYLAAYDHPTSEVGYQYNKIEILVNFPHLLEGQFLEKFRKSVADANLGERPDNCRK